MAREVIMIHVGQAGLQAGAEFWKNVSTEHHIKLNGKLDGAKAGNPDVFFEESSSGKYVPRALLVDLEPKVIRSIKGEGMNDFFLPGNVITGMYGAANNWAKGFQGDEAKKYIDKIMEALDKEVAKTESLQGFIFTHGIGGGSGGGLCSLLLERIKEKYPKKINMTFSIFPSPLLSDAVVEPYNAIMTLDSLIKHADETVVLDNHALYQVCNKSLNIPSPTYSDLNNVLSTAISDITASLRFSGDLNTDMKEFLVNLVPYPRSHFLLASYAPLKSAVDKAFSKIGTEDLVKALFEETSMMSATDLSKGTFLSCSLLFRGDNKAMDISNVITDVKSKLRFSSFIPTGIKFGMTGTAAEGLTRSGSALINHTGVSDIFQRLLTQFDMMFEKKAFVNWFKAEGLEEDQMQAARDNVDKLREEYKRDEE